MAQIVEARTDGRTDMTKLKQSLLEILRTRLKSYLYALDKKIHFNLLKTKRNLLYIRSQSVPRSKHFPPWLKISHLITYKAKVAVCSDIRTKHSTQSERHVEFFNVKPGGT